MVSDINAGTPEFSSSCMGCAQMFLSMAWISAGWQDYLLTQRCILIYCALVHVHMGVHVCVAARGHPWVSSSIAHQLVLERRSLTKPGDHQLSRPAGIHLSPLPQHKYCTSNIAHASHSTWSLCGCCGPHTCISGSLPSKPSPSLSSVFEGDRRGSSF